MKDTCQEKILFATNNKRSHCVGERRNGSVDVIYTACHGKKQPGSVLCCTKAVSEGLITCIPPFILLN